MVGRDPTPYIQPALSSSDEEGGGAGDLRSSGSGDAAAVEAWPGTGLGLGRAQQEVLLASPCPPSAPPHLAGWAAEALAAGLADGGGVGMGSVGGGRGGGGGGARGLQGGRRAEPPLSFDVQVDRAVFEVSKAHNTWGLVTLAATDSGFGFGLAERVAVDLAVVVDTSGSMAHKDKLASVLATIEYILDVLSERDRLALISFSDEAEVLFELQPMVAANKAKVLGVLHQVQAGGNTNLSEGLFKGLDLLTAGAGDGSGVLHIPRLFLLTDGMHSLPPIAACM